VVAIINMARSLDLETIAEGVETRASWRCFAPRAAEPGRATISPRRRAPRKLLDMLRQNNVYAALATASAANSN
jgi:hypothetical protein